MRLSRLVAAPQPFAARGVLRLRALVPVALVPVALVLVACIATSPDGVRRVTDGEGDGGEGFGTVNASSSVTGGTTSTDPHAVVGADPPHGPFNGGQHVIIKGKGFTVDTRVWFGTTEITEIAHIDPTTLQVTVPPGEPGAVDISTQNGDDDSTQRTLIAGYSYDELFADPSDGPVAGGTIVDIYGYQTSWDGGSVEASIDNKPCTTLDVIAPDQLRCTAPKGTPGTKSISVLTTSDSWSALDAYTYVDSSDGFKGGLSGDDLAGQLRVLVYNNITGDPIPGAHVIVGSDIGSGLYQQVDNTGVTVFNDASLDEPSTVTVAAKCHGPITFVAVPVDTLTVYLDPTLTPPCAGEGDPPPVGGNSVSSGAVTGELVWPSTQEFQKGGWNNVPTPKSDEQRIAYIFFGTRDPNKEFSIPSSSFSVTEDSPGDFGYGFSVYHFPGNHAVYALAGLRNTLTGVFTAYAMGAVKGVAMFPSQTTANVYIPMETAFDQVLTMGTAPPPPGPKGPDRLHATVAIEIAQSSYAILPQGEQTPLIPLNGALNFVGLPGLHADLLGSRYISSVSAVTGPSLTAPLSVVRRVATTSTAYPVDITGFLVVPELQYPATNGAWDGRNLSVDFPAGGFPADLTVYEINGAGGLIRWIVAVPEASNSVALPDLSGFEDAYIPDGPLLIGVYGARIDEFDYGKLRYRNLRPSGMDAYSLDYFNAHQ